MRRKDRDRALQDRIDASNRARDAREAELNKIQFTGQVPTSVPACQLCGAVVLHQDLHIPHCPARTETP